MKHARAIVCALLTAAPIGAAVAQSPVESPASTSRPHTLTLRIDNDAFDFWMQPYDRPDREYTSGVHITYDGGDAPWWSRSVFRGNASCTTASHECRMGRLELGQDIYTPLVSPDNLLAVDGSRPNAGWLYLAQSARRLRDSHSDEVTVTLGVTGPPSLARTTQTLAHHLAPEFNRPTDWSHQIQFQPGVIVRYERRERLVLSGVRAFGVDIVPHAGASVGNVSTAAELGLQTRMGWNLAHPWLPLAGGAEVAIVAGVTGRAVARDLFLDGRVSGGDGTFNSGHEPFVGTGELGVELRYRWISLAYRAVSETRAYSVGPKWHPWASMVGGVTFDR